MKKYKKILKSCALFENINEEHLLKMLECLGAKVQSFDKKYTVFAEGSTARHIGIVLSGSVQIIQNDYYGKRNILGASGPSQVFGEAFACAEISALPLCVIANEPSEIMLIDCEHILHTCTNNCGFHQQLIFNLMKILATKTLLYYQKMEVTSKRFTREKLLCYLSFEAKKAQSHCFDIPFDRQELADYLEVDRSGLSSEISKLQKEGLLISNKNRFELL